MVPPQARPYPGIMTRTIGLLALVALVPFAIFSTWVIAGHGTTGFLTLSAREPWALQMLLDVALSCLIYSVWLVPDARRHGIRAWPYLVLTLVAGSIGGLAYLVHRGLAAPSPERAIASART
jgi:hypothetical protein